MTPRVVVDASAGAEIAAETSVGRALMKLGARPEPGLKRTGKTRRSAAHT